MAKWMQLAQEKILQWKIQFEVQLHVYRKSCRCPIQTCIYHSTLQHSQGEAALLGTSVKVSDMFSICKLFMKGRNGRQGKTLPFNTLPQTLLNLRDGADLKKCQQHQEGKQCRLRISASEYRQGRWTSWRLVQLNALLVSKAEMGTDMETCLCHDGKFSFC